MANLFFIHTPLQLLVAQQIIKQEELSDNVMLCGYVDDNVHFCDLYDMIIIEDFWKAKVAMPQVARWSIISRKHVIRDGRSAYHNYKFIYKVIKEYQIDTLYLGDMKNQSCQLAAMSFHKRGLKICFFEEGSGHYVMNYGYGSGGGLIDKIYAILIDVFYYRPLFGVYYGFITYCKGFTLQDLPINTRYSIVPFYHEKFDKVIQVKPLFSERLLEFLKKEIQQIETQNAVLLLTSPFYVNGIDDNPRPYVKTIVNFAKTLHKDTKLHIKFHPRETREVKAKIIDELNEDGVGFSILGNQMNIPVEYYLQYIHYEKVVMFLCSTSFYNGYLFPKTEFVSILEDYYNQCVETGSVNAKYIKPLLTKIPQ